ncbi:hypothetical protein SASPL_157265 [Salvia splendens]|uniref:CRIB domain-containing protein n=1 Tax=Salvia splendens TaxID=180675 RepID=A0A8X8YUH9_SALSN|nr:hypothetical protein SASPL_157265 [Salvia splendens]
MIFGLFGRLPPCPIRFRVLLKTGAYLNYMNICRSCNEEGRITNLKSIITVSCALLCKFTVCRRHCGLNWRHTSPMATAVKGIFKGFKYTISQFFVVKEREIEIGYPTDVKHVAHIGWEGASGTAPSWMSEFKTGPDLRPHRLETLVLHSLHGPLKVFSKDSLPQSRGSFGSSVTSCLEIGGDFGESMQHQSGSDMFRDMASPEKKEHKRNKCKSTSSLKFITGSSSRSTRAAAKSSAKFVEGPANIEVM